MSENKQTGRRKLLVVTLSGIAVVLGMIAVWVIFRGGNQPATPDPTPSENSDRQRVVSGVRQLVEQSEELNSSSAYSVLDQSRSALESYLKLSPVDLEVQAMLADVYLRMAYLAVDDRQTLLRKAESTVDRLLAMAPNSSQALWTKGQIVEFGGGKDFMHYYRVAADGPNATPEYWLKFARVLIRDERKGDRWGEAEVYLRKCVDAGMNSADILVARADMAIYRGKKDEAVELLRQATQLDKTDAMIWGRLAEMQMDGGNLDGAMATIQQGRQSCSRKNAGLLDFKCGELYMARKDWEKAASSFISAAQTESLAGRASLEAARCYYYLGQNRAAMKYLDNFLKLSYPDSSAELPADVLELKNKIEDARFGPVQP